MSAVYTIADDMLYRIDQDVETPTNLVTYTSNNMLITSNPETKTATLDLWLNSIDREHTKTNHDLVFVVKDQLRRQKVTQIDTLSNIYKMAIDYQLLDRKDREIEHSVSVYPLKPVDSMLPLGVTKHDGLPFRYVKTFSKQIDFRFRQSVPFGIMKNKEDTYFLRINDIRIFQDTNPKEELHPSLEGRAMIRNSHTVASYLEHTVLIYSSKEEGIELSPCRLNFIPRVMTLRMEILLDNFMVVYDEGEIDRILIENIGIVNGEELAIEAVEPHHHHHHHHHDEPCHHRHGIYVLSESRKRDSLLVVEDLYPPSEFNAATMVRKCHVLPDIPSIQVGDYVRFVEDCIDPKHTEPFIIYDSDHPDPTVVPCRYDDPLHRGHHYPEPPCPPWLKE